MHRRRHLQNDVVIHVVEYQHQLHIVQMIQLAKLSSSGGTCEIHRFRADGSPGADVLEIQARFFLLKHYSHLLNDSALQMPPPSLKRTGGRAALSGNRVL
jgi:hypothetical protein